MSPHQSLSMELFFDVSARQQDIPDIFRKLSRIPNVTGVTGKMVSDSEGNPSGPLRVALTLAAGVNAYEIWTAGFTAGFLIGDMRCSVIPSLF